MRTLVIFIYLFLTLSPALAQESKQFYELGGGKILSAKLGELEQLDLQVIHQLYYPKISIPAQERLKLAQAEAGSHSNKEIKLQTLKQLATRELSLGAYANLVLGDNFWNQTKERANFLVASSYYLKALELALNSSEHLEGIVFRVLTSVARPKWLTSGDSISYGAFGNFLPFEKLMLVRQQIRTPALLMLVDLRIAQSKSRQGASVSEICESINKVLDLNLKNETRAEGLLLLSQYVGPECKASSSSTDLLKQIIKEFGATKYPAVARAKALLEVEQKSVFTLEIEPKEDSSELPLPKVIRLTGSRSKKTLVTISELGLLTDEGLRVNRVEITPWLTSPAKIVSSFFAPTKMISSQNNSVGDYDNLARLPSAPYVLSAGGEQHYALNSELLLLLARQKDQLFIQSVSLKSGSAIPDVRLEIHSRTPNGLDSVRKTKVLVSDVTGLASITNPKKACLAVQDCDSEEIVIIGQKFRHISALGVNFEKIIWPFEGDPEFWIVPSATSVRPGETVTWNLIARPDIFRRFSTSIIQYVLVHPTGVRVGERNTEFDRFGRAAGATQISRKFSPGVYHVEVKVLSKLTGELLQFSHPIMVN